MLTILLSHKLSPDEKKEKLTAEFDMKMERKLKGAVNKMCNLSQIIVDETTKKVTLENMIQAIDNVMESFSVTLEEACKSQKTSVDEYYRAKEFLGR